MAPPKSSRELKTAFADTGYWIIYQTPALFRAAVRLYETHADKGWGLTDCVSFSIMRDRGVVDALAYDIHFVQAGFNALLR
jgi:predicted nucleic acid-binding protein